VIHLLTMYPPEEQKYGREFFTDLDGNLDYLNLDYIEAGYIASDPNGKQVNRNTFFLAKVPKELPPR
jgi:hypothetical protein